MFTPAMLSAEFCAMLEVAKGGRTAANEGKPMPDQLTV